MWTSTVLQSLQLLERLKNQKMMEYNFLKQDYKQGEIPEYCMIPADVPEGILKTCPLPL